MGLTVCPWRSRWSRSKIEEEMEMDGAPVEREEVEEKAATNLIDVDNLVEISLK